MKVGYNAVLTLANIQAESIIGKVKGANCITVGPMVK